MGKLRQDDSGGRGRWGVGEGEWGWQQDVVNLCALLGRLPVFTLLPDNDGCGHLQEVEKTTSCKSFHLQALLASSLWGDCFVFIISACLKIDLGHGIFWMTPTCFIINCLHGIQWPCYLWDGGGGEGETGDSNRPSLLSGSLPRYQIPGSLPRYLLSSGGLAKSLLEQKQEEWCVLRNPSSLVACAKENPSRRFFPQDACPIPASITYLKKERGIWIFLPKSNNRYRSCSPKQEAVCGLYLCVHIFFIMARDVLFRTIFVILIGSHSTSSFVP